MKSLRQYDVGVVLSISVRDQDDALVAIPAGATATIWLRSPGGRVKQRAATAVAGQTSISYTTTALDLDEWGVWSIQGQLVASSPAIDISTTIVRLEVGEVLRAPILVVDCRPAIVDPYVPPPTLSLV